MTNKSYNVTVLLNVYDLHQCNGCLWHFGFGIFHCGVQLKYEDSAHRHSKEYSYLGNILTESTGVFHTEPKQTFGAKYRITQNMGDIQISNRELSLILDRLRIQYLAKDYDILTQNCNHFCDSFVYELTNKYIASWINRTASMAACCQCCIPQSFYDALFEVQANCNNNNNNNNDKALHQTQSLSKSTSSISSWIYQSSYLHQEINKNTKKRKIYKNGHCVESDSDNDDNDNDNDEGERKYDINNNNKNNKDEIDDYMNYGHSVSIIGLKSNDNDKKPKIKPITTCKLGINPLNEHIVLSSKKNNFNDDNNKKNKQNRSNFKKYSKSPHLYALKKRLSSEKIIIVDTLNSSSSNDNDRDRDSDMSNSTNWTNHSYQKLPKTPPTKSETSDLTAT